MKSSPMKDILEMVEERNIACGAYVTVFYEAALAATEASTGLDIPVIFIIDTDYCDSMGGFERTMGMVRRAMKAADYKVPVALHPNHCRAYEECVQTIQAGYSPIMIDGSSLPFEENMTLTKKVAGCAHCYGITTEGKLGKLMGEEGSFKVEGGPEPAQIDPDQAKESMECADIDYIVVSIGMQHGVYVAAPHLNIGRLKKIHDVVDVPVVFHDGSGTPKEQVQEAIRNGTRRTSIATDVLIAVANSFEDMKQKPDFKYSIGMSVSSRTYAREPIEGKMREFILMD